ncbi:LysR family transcriptional regulator [Aeromicrobium chenweiae]|uniref:LysR family transcriptional regulator n=1 Tax=Aeromicrobium chenweiae TaxID=2079793 RepID=A0A2S0WLH3_9ACTN|nr:LysR family transcriptional regulator [Aeromicrobium chenweiae]AWB92142.1 LysR family transcriptional regulator [Aeromicrobium chenweiae]TGN32993.1 LysR family transcriptional regulator [Aeromicrobium chenweiae]
MELGQLRALRELGDRGSIAAVAAAMRVTPSSVSQQISALQRRSPVPLTYRDGRRTALTDAGRALARAAIDVEVALERAEQAVARFQDDRTGTVSVAAFHSAGLAAFAPLIMALNGPDQPDVRVSDFDVAQEDFPSLTTDHDLVLAHRLVGSPRWPASVRVEPLVFEPLDVVVRGDHQLAAKSSIESADLAGEKWVAVHEGFPLEQAIAAIAGISGDEAHVVHRINEFQVAASVVSASDCIALMPRYTSDLRSHPDLVLRPLAHPGLGRYIDCLARPETLERATVKTVLAEIRRITTDLTRRWAVE